MRAWSSIRAWSLLLDSCHGNRTLRCCEKPGLLRPRILAPGGTKSIVGNPQEPMTIRRQFRQLRGRLVAIKYFGDGLALVGSEGRNKDQRLNSFIGAGGDHCAGVGMCHKNDRSVGPLQRALEGCDVI